MAKQTVVFPLSATRVGVTQPLGSHTERDACRKGSGSFLCLDACVVSGVRKLSSSFTEGDTEFCGPVD